MSENQPSKTKEYALDLGATLASPRGVVIEVWKRKILDSELHTRRTTTGSALTERVLAQPHPPILGNNTPTPSTFAPPLQHRYQLSTRI
ncbi:unnamed protein product [Nezara viridula]|uniref:Uncharacterized protein n=1 Tax=Nezara viridula TaxID=85310 RepID=A0A9P0E3B0_NEZVI|nr:unnamed protein product [Nezara viridula]